MADLWVLRDDDVEGLIDRALLPGEADRIKKALGFALDDAWADAVYAVTDQVVTSEIRASELKDGDFFREYGDLGGWYEAVEVDRRGDTMLIDLGQQDSDMTLDIDTVIERAIITQSEEDKA